MKSRKKRKIIIILSVFIVILAGLTIYFSQEYWQDTYGIEGYCSKETYLEGGTGSYEYSKDTRVHYVYMIEAGGMHYELTDKEGNIVYEMDVTESCEGYIPFDNETPELYYDHGYALSEDTRAGVDITVQVKVSNFRRFLVHLNQAFNNKLFGYDFSLY